MKRIMLLAVCLMMALATPVFADATTDVNQAENALGIDNSDKKILERIEALEDELGLDGSGINVTERLKRIKYEIGIEEEASTAESGPGEKEAKGAANNGTSDYKEKISMFDIYEDSLGKLRYDAIVEIENTGNVPLYLDAKSFDVETGDGHLVQTDSWITSCPDAIYPGEKGYFYNQTGEFNDQTINVNDLVLVPKYRIEKANQPPHEFPVEDLSIADGTFGLTVTGRIFNDTNEEESIYVHVIFYDADMNCLGVTGTNVLDMAPNEYTSFEVSGIGLQHSFDASQLDNYFVYARENVYQW